MSALSEFDRVPSVAIPTGRVIRVDGPGAQTDTIEFQMTVSFDAFGALLGEPTVDLLLYRDPYTEDLTIWQASINGGPWMDFFSCSKAHSSAVRWDSLLAFLIASIEAEFAKPSIKDAAADEWVKAYGRVAA